MNIIFYTKQVRVFLFALSDVKKCLTAGDLSEIRAALFFSITLDEAVGWHG